jgi:hypothetical protein
MYNELETKFNDIWDNYINGNLSDFKTQLQELTKINLLKFIDFIDSNYEYSGETLAIVLKYIE